MVKNPPSTLETWVQSLDWEGFPGGSVVKNPSNAGTAGDVGSLGREDPLEKGMTIYSSILAWRIQWTEEPGGLWSIGSQRVRHE